MTEAAIQRAVLAYLRTAVCQPAHFHVTDLGSMSESDRKRRGRAGGASGWPDITGCADGRFIALEVKSAKGRVRKAQTAVLDALTAAGGVVGVVRSVEDAARLLHAGGVALRAWPAGMARPAELRDSRPCDTENKRAEEAVGSDPGSRPTPIGLGGGHDAAR